MRMKNFPVVCAWLLLMAGCKTLGGDAKNISSAKVADNGSPPQSAAPSVVGLDILEDRPAMTQISEDVNPTTDWELNSGAREYWLNSSRGHYMTYKPDQRYAPFRNEQACADKLNDPQSACSIQPDNVARECQRIASSTLKAIMEDEPEDFRLMNLNFKGEGEDEDSFMLFGWVNDAHSDRTFATSPSQGPFIWRGSRGDVRVTGNCPENFKFVSGYIKWVSSVSPTGLCMSPSKGQMLALLKKAHECLKQNSGGP